MSYRTTIHVGVYWEGYNIDLSRSRWFWLAWLKAWWHLLNHPYRAAQIKRVKEQ